MSQGEGGGRPLMVIDDEQATQVEALAAYLTQEQIADYFEMSHDTFARILERQPEVLRKYKRGKAKAVGSIAKNLIKMAQNGNITAAIFYLKTQAGWKEVSRTEHTGADGADLMQPTIDVGSLSDETLKEIMRASVAPEQS